MSVTEGRERWTPVQLALVAIIIVLIVGVGAIAAFTLGRMQPSGSTTPSTLPSPSPGQPIPSKETAQEAVCSAFEGLWDLQTDHAIPLSKRFLEWIPDFQATLDVPATYADARAIGEGSVIAGTKITSLAFPADPALIVSMKQSVAGYAEGSVSLKEWLDAGSYKTHALPGASDAMQQLSDGANALGDANLRVAVLYASGALPCDARY